MIFHKFDAFVKQPQGVHRGLGVVAKLLGDLGPLAMLPFTTLAAHALELRFGISKILPGMVSGQKDLAVRQDGGPLGFASSCGGEERVQDGGIALGSQ